MKTTPRLRASRSAPPSRRRAMRAAGGRQVRAPRSWIFPAGSSPSMKWHQPAGGVHAARRRAAAAGGRRRPWPARGRYHARGARGSSVAGASRSARVRTRATRWRRDPERPTREKDLIEALEQAACGSACGCTHARAARSRWRPMPPATSSTPCCVRAGRLGHLTPGRLRPVGRSIRSKAGSSAQGSPAPR